MIACVDIATIFQKSLSPSSAQAAQKARAPSKNLAAGLYASGAVAFLASAVAAATTGARGLAPFATLATFALVCVKA